LGEGKLDSFGISSKKVEGALPGTHVDDHFPYLITTNKYCASSQLTLSQGAVARYRNQSFSVDGSAAELAAFRGAMFANQDGRLLVSGSSDGMLRLG
jgi:hypothetical protein